MSQVSVRSFSDRDDRYDDFLTGVQKHFDARIATAPRLFTTDAQYLWNAYLNNAPPGERQSRTCRSCQSFVERFGGLVTISETGVITSAVWPEHAPPMYSAAVSAMRRLVERANVTGVFRTKEAVWGTPTTGTWDHIALRAPRALLSTSKIDTPHQEMATKLEEFRMLGRSLAEFRIDTVRQALALLTSDALYRSEKCEGVARWLLELHESLTATKNMRTYANLVWLAVAKAPAGYCHVRSNMIGTLLEDINAGYPLETVKRRWAEKMNPLQYMRPTAPPTAGNIAQAERVMAALRSAGGLERRFARLEDIQALWLPRPAAKPAPAGGVFGHLAKAQPNGPGVFDTPAQVMTWAKFSSTVLPNAEEIEFYVPYGRREYTAMVTAKHADAPNLLQWDNPVSHYVYHGGSHASRWNLAYGQYHRVTAVTLRSWMWGGADRFAHHGAGVVFVLQGARDREYVRSGGMFPEQMKPEYHAIRSTLSAHFASYTVEGRLEAEACGVALVKGSATWGDTFRVTSRGVRSTYKLDRWD